MKVKSNLKHHWARWEDPGDYPSAMGARALPPGPAYVEEISSAVVFTAEPGETLPPIDALLEDAADYAYPAAVKSWAIEYGDRRATFTPLDYDTSNIEPDYDSHDDYLADQYDYINDR